MSREIDLGNDTVYDVKVNGDVYQVREPKIKDATEFQKAQKSKGEGEEMELFLIFLENLGLPRDVSENLALSKVKMLTQKIMGDLEKK